MGTLLPPTPGTSSVHMYIVHRFILLSHNVSAAKSLERASYYFSHMMRAVMHTRVGRWLRCPLLPRYMALPAAYRCCSTSTGGRQRTHPAPPPPVPSQFFGLNSLSASVRVLLKEHQLAVADPTARTAAQLRLLYTLARVLSVTPQGTNSDALHPLLCVRVLQQLQYAEFSRRGATGTPHRGWMQEATNSLRDGAALAAVAARVLAPLAPLLAGAGHPHVQPVAAIALEWWAALPPTPALPTSTWLPLMMAHYEKSIGDKSSAEDPPLHWLLPLVARRILECPSSKRTAKADLRAWLRLCGVPAVLEGNVASRTEASHACLTRAMFWQGTTALLAEPLVQEALGAPDEAAASAPLNCPIGIADDATFRRFLLRLAASNAAERGEVGLCASGTTTALLTPFVEAQPTTRAEEPGTENADSILRWVHPLLEYLEATYRPEHPSSAPVEGGARPALRLALSFVGVTNVLSSVLDRGEALRRQSCAPLLPKRGNTPLPPFPVGSSPLPERFTLLPHKPRLHALKRACELLLHHSRRAQGTATDSAGASDTAPELPWFADVSLQEQEVVLRRFCGTARALVRVTMEEKRLSVVHEGPDGAALAAGGRQCPPFHEIASMTAISDVLRNTAYRVLEPSLAVYYEACAWQPGLATLTLEELHTMARSEGCGSSWSGLDSALMTLHRDVGGASGLQTARHILRHPMQQPLAAVVEGIRLVCVHGLALNERAVVTAVEEDLLRSFQSAWTRSTSDVTESAEGSSTTRASQLPHRLLLLVLLSLLRCASSMTSRASSLPNAVVELLLRLTQDGAVTEWAALGLPCTVCEATRGWALPEEGMLPAGVSTQWGLCEELHQMGDGGLNHCQPPPPWQWLGSTSEVRSVVHALLDRDASNREVTGDYAPLRLLLPWSTVAHSRQPLRLYDESGQSQRGAEAFDAHLQTIHRACLEGTVVVRVVSIVEEMQFFAEVGRQARTVLDAEGLTVVNEAVGMEERLRKNAAASSFTDWSEYDDDGYDGLD